MRQFGKLICALWLLPFFAYAQKEENHGEGPLSHRERAVKLVGQMTIDEKISLMMDESPEIKRLNIPGYNWWNEALHGVGRSGLSTVLPQTIGMAATFDDSLVYRAFDMVSDEARAKYNAYSKKGNLERYQGLTFWTPNINIFRDPRWGRGQETYGEDPYLTSRMGVAVVKGLQGPSDGKYLKTIACAKHYAVHSGPEWSRHSFDARDLDAQDLWETYLPAFKALVEAGVGQVMCAYNRYEGEPCCSNKKLLQKILRDEWGYDRIVVSDCGAISDFINENAHHTHPSGMSASADAVRSGTDVECGSVYKNLREAYDAGLIDEATIDRSLIRLMEARYRIGEIDGAGDVPWNSLDLTAVDNAAHKALALEVARKSMTLLKNNGILPLPVRGKRILVMGPNANDSVMQWGNYNGTPSHTVTILEGIRSVLPEVTYLKGCDHVMNIDVDLNSPDFRNAEVVIFAGGISPALEGEEMNVAVPGFRGGDRETIELPAVQRNLIKEIHDAGKKIVFVNCSGSAVAIAQEDSICDAILQAWYPGQAGGRAVADVIFGKYNPAGRLPVTFYKNDKQLPDFENYSMENRTYRFMREKPLYPFGYGLSYTDFDYGKVCVSDSVITPDNSVSITIPVTNTGHMDGDEVVQIYMKRKDDYCGPEKTLRAYRRVTVPAGVTTPVTFELGPEFFATFDYSSERMRTMPGDYEISYGGSSDASDKLTISIVKPQKNHVEAQKRNP